MNDLCLAVRSHRATPVVTMVAILSLALGIGATSAIFSIADSLLFRTLPVDRPDRLGLLMSIPTGARPGVSAWSNPVWQQIRDRRHELFETAFAFSARPVRFNLASRGQTEFVDGQFVSGDYFDGLGVQAVLGRALTPADDAPGGPNGPVAVISHAFWQRRFGGAADVIGRTQAIDRVPFTIVGVLPQRFFGADVGTTFDVAVPLGTEPLIRGRDSYLDRPTTSWLAVMVRLKDGQTLSAAQDAVHALQPHIRDVTMPQAFSPESQARYLITPIAIESAAIGSSRMRGRYRQPVLTILLVVALVLLVACANTANLLLARATARRHEFNVRVALGASRWRLARMLLGESLVLAGVSSVLGLGIALWASRLLVRQMSTFSNTVFLDVRLDWRVIAFTAAVTAIAAFLFGVVPALRASRADPIGAIREHGRGSSHGRRRGVSEALVVGQVAVSLIVVVTAGLFARTFGALATRDLGFDRDAVLIAQLDLRASAAGPADRGPLYDRLAAAAGDLVGVARAAVSDITPVSGSLTDTVVEIENGPPMTMPGNVSYRNVITPGWFATYGTDVLGGRDFDVRDRLGSPLVTIVNETFVRRFLQDAAPVGRRIRQGQPGRQGPWLEIVGVVEDAAYRSVRDPVPPTLYVPMAHVKEPPSGMSLSVRSAGGAPVTLSQELATAITRVDPNVAVTFTPLKQQVDAALVQERILAMVAGFSAVVALLLAGLGLYGIVWYAVSRRRVEIGIRRALGATPANVAGLVLFRTSLLVGTGIAVGVTVCWWTSRSVASLLYGVDPRDVVTMISAAGILAAIGLLAAWKPVRTISRIEPAEVLRNL